MKLVDRFNAPGQASAKNKKQLCIRQLKVVESSIFSCLKIKLKVQQIQTLNKQRNR